MLPLAKFIIVVFCCLFAVSIVLLQSQQIQQAEQQQTSSLTTYKTSSFSSSSSSQTQRRKLLWNQTTTPTAATTTAETARSGDGGLFGLIPAGVTGGLFDAILFRRHRSTRDALVFPEEERRLTRRKRRPDEIPHVVYDDLRYRRVCADVHSSTLCLTVRFPFEVPVQDPNVTFVHPFSAELYRDLIHWRDFGAAVILDGDLLEGCKNRSAHLNTTHDKVRDCLERAASEAEIASNGTLAKYVHAVWTKRRQNKSEPQQEQSEEPQEAVLWGTQSPQQKRRISDFFDGQVTIFVGDSLSPGVSRCVSTLLTENNEYATCQDSGDARFFHLRTSLECLPRKNNSNSNDTSLPSWSYPGRPTYYGSPINFTGLDPDVTFLANIRYHHDASRAPPYHHLPKDTLVERMKQENITQSASVGSVGSGFTRLRPLTLIALYPISHAQNEIMITNMTDKVHELNTEYQRLFLSGLQTAEGRRGLAELGFELKRIIAFDGVPQFFPSATGGPFAGQPANISANHTCAGPVPPNSPFTAVKDMAAEAWQEFGLRDADKWYGRIWEFSNLFWWQSAGFQPRGYSGHLDCTHSWNWNNGMYCMHKYFVMSMVDDHYDYDHDYDDDLEEGR